MKIDAKIIVFTDDAHEQWQDLPLREKAMADIVLGVSDSGSPAERTHVYKSRTSLSGVSYDHWRDVLCDILEGHPDPTIDSSKEEYDQRITEHLQSPQG